jgi:hypothetical protein
MLSKVMILGVVGLGVALAATGGGCSSTTSASDAGAATPCAALRACCDKLAGAAKDRCLLSTTDDTSCQNSQAQYCGVDPTACTKLASCCPTLAADKQGFCETQVKTYTDDAELCQLALKDYTSCAGASVDAGTKPDTGGGGTPSCDALGACCAKLPDPAKGRCSEIVDRADDLRCGNSKDNYCRLDPAACKNLKDCCATLPAEDKSVCEFQVSNYGTDVELCGIALDKYPSCAP